MNKAVVLLTFLIFISCSAPRIESLDPALGKTFSSLDAFLALCEKDLGSGAKVVADNDIVKNLTHLQLMNKGGDKYYPLERENISKMILAVTEGIYDDFILVNAKGTVIYTMTNNDLFAKNVRTALSGTALKGCYDAKEDIHFGGLVSGEWSHFNPSKKIAGDDRSSGFFMLQVSKEKIRSMIPPGITILAGNGTVLISPEKETEGTLYIYISLMKTEGGGSFAAAGKEFCYQSYRRSNLNWIVVTSK